MTDTKPPTETEIDDLFINNADFNAIAEHVNRFNPIRVMGMEDKEIRHSAILAWLLNPHENHGLGDILLKQFLASAIKNQNQNNETAISVLDIMTADLNDAIVENEKKVDGGNIDIVIECPNNNWVFVIENKIHSGLGDNQLERYETIENIYEKNYKFSYVFLTKNGDVPNNKQYHPASHKQVFSLLQNIIQTHTLSTEIITFIRQYIDTLKEILGMTDIELEKKARNLYSEHKKVIDFIIANKNKTAFESAVNRYIKNNDNMFGYTHIDSSLFIFIPKEWQDQLVKIKDSKDFTQKENTRHWRHNYPTMCFIELKEKNKLYSKTEFRDPEYKDFKNNLQEVANYFVTKLSTDDYKIKKIQNKKNKDKPKQIYLTVPEVKIKDVLDEDEMYEKIEIWFEKYKENVIDKITNELPKWIKQ